MSRLKVYKIKANEATLNFRIGSCNVVAHFKDGDIGNGVWAKLSTKDGRVQLAIERSSMYGKQVFLDFTGDNEAVMDPSKIATMAEAVEYLVKRHGIKRASLRSMDKVVEEAGKLGIEFPNMK